MAASAYQLQDNLHRGGQTSVFRGVRRTDGAAVVLKRLNPDFVGPGDVAQLRREFAIARQLAGPGIVPVLEFDSDRDACAIVMADSGGVSLAQKRRERLLTLAEILEVGAQVAAALARIHASNVVHKDINPSNIVWNDATGVVEVIDFGIAAELACENAPNDVARLEGTLAYIAPEQTGRMNRSLDWRSDLYALGATLYDLLIGHPPFGGRDRLEMIHGHIARPPEPPHHLNPSVPAAVSAIVLKLLAKEPEQRYQSARGVQADLEACLAALRAGAPERMEAISLGRHDHSPRFQVPERLYGRDADIDALMASFERAAKGAPELLLVTGRAGIGKSALVQEIQKPLTGARGWFAEGKFDQFKRNIPYSALVQALNDLAGLLLAEPEAMLDQRRAALARAVGVNGRVVTELVPAFAVILGEPPPLPPVPPAENELRFQITFQNLFMALATAERPLVLFLDDLQWADRSSLALLGKLATDPDMRHLLVIGTSRPDGLETGQPLERLTGEIVDAGGRVTTLVVGPLTPVDVMALVAATVHRDDDAVRALAVLCYDKTQGNPFFLSQFLKSLHEDGLIVQDADGCWTWDPARIAGRDSTDNVVDLVVAKLRRLAPACGDIVSRAACIGNVFDLATLSAATGTPAAQIGGELWPALHEGLILPLDSTYRTLASGDADVLDAVAPTVRFRFLHDRVQQAAYTLIAADKRAAVHARLGRLLLAEVADGPSSERLFEILNHLNLGSDLVTDPTERRTLIELNLAAARRAKAQAAFGPALDYARAGIVLAEARRTAGVGKPTLLALYDEAVTAAGMAGDHALTETYAKALLARTGDGLEQAHVQAVRMTARLTRGDADEALSIGLAALKAVGIRMPRRIGRLRAAFERLRGAWLFQRYHSTPLEIPPDARPTPFTNICELLVSHISPIHTARPDLMLPLAVRLLAWSAKTGDAGVQSIARTFWGMSCAAAGDLAGAARAFADAATVAADTPTMFGNAPQGVYLKLYIDEQWSLPWTVQHERLQVLTRQSFDRGDHEFGGYAAANAPWCAWHAGVDLATLDTLLDDTLHRLERIGNRYNELHLRALWQGVANLRLGGERPSRLDGARLNQDEAFGAMRRGGLFTALALASLAKIQLAVFYGEDGEARAALAETTAMLDVDTAFKDALTLPSFVFYRALALTGSPSSGAREWVADRRTLAAAIRRFRAWTTLSPALHGHRLLLLRAESARIGKRLRGTAALYEQAVAAAAAAGALHEEALAAERAALFHEGCGAALAAGALRVRARHAYRRWGAFGKVRALERRFPGLAPLPGAPAAGSPVPTDAEAVGGTISSVSTSIDDLAGGRVDFEAVMTAARAISGEIRRDTLLETLLRTVLHLAGAGRGLLLLQAGGGRLTLVAEADAASGLFRLLPEPVAVEGQAIPGLPVSIVSYAVRTGEAVVLADAGTAPRFADDPDVQARRPRSVLCLPLLHQGSLVGVLHLENNLASDAFVNQRLEAPRLLAAQIAISLENARLYDELSDFNRALEAQVAERTSALRLALDSEREVHEQLLTAQSQLVQAEKLASLGQMMAGVAHEINTPLGIAITSASHLADETVKLKHLTGGGRMRRLDFDHYLATAEEATDLLLSNLGRTADLVHSFKQVAIDQASDERRRFDLRGYLDELLVSLGPVWRKGGHRIEVSCPAGLELDGYPGVLAQILTNLVVNSITHGFEPGQSGRMTITVTAPDRNTLELVYTDDGRGISEEHRAKVFDPFFTTKRGAGSTGLGLHIVHNLVTAKLNGRIELDRAEPGGTRFVVQFPRVVPELVS